MPRLRSISFRRKFLLAFLIAAFVPLTVFAGFSLSSTSRALHKQADLDMTRRSDASLAALNADGSTILEQVRSFGEWNAFCAAIDRRNIAWLESNVTVWTPKNTVMKGVQALTVDGTVVSAGGQFKHVSLQDSPVVTAAAKGEVGYDFENIGGRLYIVGAGPVVEEDITDPAQHGIVVFGQPLDKIMLDQLATFTGANEIALYVDERLVVSSGDLSPPIQPLVDAGTPFAQGHFHVILTELRNQRGEVQGVLRASIESKVITITSTTLQRTSEYAMLLALLIAVALGLVMTGAVGRPLRRLAQAASAIAHGETRQHIDIVTRDEIGEVAQAFNTMSERITQELEGMSDKIRGLTVEISSLNAFGETLTQLPDVRGELRRLTGMVGETLSCDLAVLFLSENDEFALAAYAGELHLPEQRLEDVCTQAALTGKAVSATVAGPDQVAVSGDDADDRHAVSVMAVPLFLRESVGGVLAVGSATRSFREDDVSLLMTIGGQIAIGLQNAEAYARLDDMYLQTVTALAAAMEAKDQYTGKHADSLAAMALAVGRRIGLSDAELRQLHYAAVLHDIGKIGIPGSILNKPDKLTKAEFAVMAQHTIIGERILSSIEYLQPIARIVRSAHERWDGHGYPDGLAGEAIPLPSRIVLACDAFDAMTTDRPYRKAMLDDAALAELRTNSGTQFDPAVIAAFEHEFAPHGRIESAGDAPPVSAS